MKITNLANLPEEKFARIKNDLANLKTLGQVLSWASTKSKDDLSPQIVAETIAQDEYSIDVIIPFRDVFIVFDTT